MLQITSQPARSVLGHSYFCKSQIEFRQPHGLIFWTGVVICFYLFVLALELFLQTESSIQAQLWNRTNLECSGWRWRLGIPSHLQCPWSWGHLPRLRRTHIETTGLNHCIWGLGGENRHPVIFIQGNGSVVGKFCSVHSFSLWIHLLLHYYCSLASLHEGWQGRSMLLVNS